jgi:hypothetical protein
MSIDRHRSWLASFPTLLFDFTPDRRGAYPLADAFFDHVLDSLGNPRIALHQSVQVMSIKPQ